MQKSPCFKNQHRTTHTFLKDAKDTKVNLRNGFTTVNLGLTYKISIFKIYIYICLFGYLTLDFKSNSTKQFNIYSNLSNSSIQMPYKKIFDNTVPEKTQKSNTQQRITPFQHFYQNILYIIHTFIHLYKNTLQTLVLLFVRSTVNKNS